MWWCIGPMTNSSVKVIVALVVCLLFASCSTDPEKETVASSPAPVPQSEVFWSSIWSATPGIDLYSRAGELVRATVEAGYLAQAYGVEKSFPGYLDAIGGFPLPAYDDPRRKALAAAYAPPDLGPGAPDLTELFYHVVDLTDDGSTVTAKVCEYALLPTPSRPLKFLGKGEAVTLTRGEGPVGRPGIADTGRNSKNFDGKIPDWNVYGSWLITESRGLRGATLPSQCAPWFLSVFPDATFRHDVNIVELPGLSPTASGKAQYPKWIGPAVTE
jgi:hypothetical protein